MLKYYNNQYLFSEIYLDEITNLDEDRSLTSTLETISETALYADKNNLSLWNRTFVHELLRTLKFKVDLIDENVALLKQYGEDDKPLTICYSLLPDKNLDNSLMGSNYAYEIISSLKKYNLKWGILTNGNQWRIYHTDEPMPYENYLEIDLESILNQQDKSAFQLIFFFLKSENFIVDEAGNSKFDLFKKESQNKIAYIEDELKNALKQKEEGGQDILSNICFGYVQYLRNEGTDDFSSEDLRDEIYGGSLLYMFRLLFLFYARARDLMTEEDSKLYDELVNKAKEYHTSGNANSSSKELWVQLRTIFGEIDRVYNGGLFNRDENKYTRFIENATISDSLLSGVIYNMSHYEEKNGMVKPISYRDMNVRHLGTLYEGLLEHKLFVAEEDIEVKVTKKEIQFIPESQGGKIKEGQYIPKGQVYFGNDKGLRKATGSYYTPEYIVEYIVTNTVDEKLNKLKLKFDKQIEPLIQDIEVAISEKEKQQVRLLIKNQTVEFVENEILALSVLDPAMGSGHFLVNATSHIANFITTFLNSYRVESDFETYTKYWSRRVVENCIYGVDLNILATELAKLSLWILTMAKDKPLSFLNHHLKIGNSLIGTKLSELGRHPFSKIEQSQKDLFTQDPDFKSIVQKVIDDYSIIQRVNSDSKINIETKKEYMDEIDKFLKPYKDLCDLHTSIYFGNHIYEEDYNSIIFNKVQSKISFNEKYFHWELEFPDILLKNNGFDCVIGNPPYVVVENGPYRVQIKDTLTANNLFTYFSEIAINYLSNDGIHSFIVPMSGFASNKMVQYQEFLIDNSYSLKCINFAERPSKIFKGADLSVTIFFLNKSKNGIKTFFSSNFIRWYKNENGAPLSKIRLVNSLKYLNLSKGFFPKIGEAIELSILDKMLKNNPLGQYLSNKPKQAEEIYYRSKGGRYYKIISDISFGSSNEIAFSCVSSQFKRALVAILNSNFFFWFYDCFSSNRVLSRENIDAFPVALDTISSSNLNELAILADELMKDYQRNAEAKTTNYSNYGNVNHYTIYARKSKNIMDRIDKVLGDHYILTDDEVSYLTNYCLRYRIDD